MLLCEALCPRDGGGLVGSTGRSACNSARPKKGTGNNSKVCSFDSWLEAGADIIETNTYQASVAGFEEHLQLSASDACQVEPDLIFL